MGRRSRISKNVRQCITQYGQRNALLRELGFATYADYLASERWSNIREVVLKRDQWICTGCGDRATQVHHHSYAREVLLGSNLRPLSAICRRCHQQIEFDRRNGKLAPSRANRKLRAKRRRSKGRIAQIKAAILPPSPTATEIKYAQHRRYFEKCKEINRTLSGRKRVVALADAMRERSAEIGRKSGIISPPTYPTGDATLFLGKSKSRRQKVVSAP
jgi:hypothetical protein